MIQLGLFVWTLRDVVRVVLFIVCVAAIGWAVWSESRNRKGS